MAGAPLRTALLCVALLSVGCEGAPGSGDDGGIRRIPIDTVPALDLGVVEGDTSELFNQVVGATRLADGTVIVADRGSAQLKYFGPDGRLARAAGRKGTGPGEFGYMAGLLRCGDSLFVKDISVRGHLAFGTDGGYGRTMRSEPPEAGRTPYSTVCSADRSFFHYAYENIRVDGKIGVYRANVPFWITDSEGAVVRVLGRFPGSERLGVPNGSRPLPLGKQTAIALANDRAYIGTADGYEIVVTDHSGRALDTLRRDDVDLQTTPADIELFKQADLAGTNPTLRDAIERSYATTPFPERIPAYSALILDRPGNLWVQDYPRGASPLVRWSIFSPTGALVAETLLPSRLEVYEIGEDYVLGKSLEPPYDVEHVRVYRFPALPGT